MIGANEAPLAAPIAAAVTWALIAIALIGSAIRERMTK